MASALGAAQARAPQPPHDFGTPPTWNAFREAAEAGVRATLRDPDSAKFRWEKGFAPGRWTLVDGYPWGYAACGYVNARNAYGGFVGETAFAVVVENGQAVGVELNRPNGTLEILCRQAGFPPMPEDSSVVAVDASLGPASTIRAANPPFGLELTAVPDGAYVGTVDPTGAAGKAGIKPGMVIERVNGLAIRGLAKSAVDQMLASSSDKLTLTMIGGQSYSLAGVAR